MSGANKHKFILEHIDVPSKTPELFSLLPCKKAVLVLTLIFTFQNDNVYADNNKELEINIKAAYLYNFLHFVDWPKNINQPESNICVYGVEERHRTAFNSMASLGKKDSKISIKLFEADAGPRGLSSCQIIFITDNAKHKSNAILDYLKHNQSLTVGESDGFINRGGMINFILVQGKVRFEINHDVVKAAGLKISSKVLRIAEKVISDEDV
tara:strand:- start:5238 stop:5870 length:633 start_codon:yes stop_codon:yes gene_type:complete